MSIVCVNLTHHDRIISVKLFYKAAGECFSISTLRLDSGLIKIIKLDDRFNRNDLINAEMTFNEFQSQLLSWKDEFTIANGILCLEANLGEPGGEQMTEFAKGYSKQLMNEMGFTCLTLFTATEACIDDAENWAQTERHTVKSIIVTDKVHTSIAMHLRTMGLDNTSPQVSFVDSGSDLTRK